MAKWENASGCINILKDLYFEDIPALAAEKPLKLIQFYVFTNPNNHTWDVLNEFFGSFPEIGLRLVWNHAVNFDFYERLPNLRNIKLACYYTTDFDRLLANRNLQHLTIEETRSRKIDFSFIGEFPALRSLYLEGDIQGIESIASVKTLERLTLRRVKRDNLDFLASLQGLSTLRLFYGSYLNVEGIESLENLKHLELSRIKRISDFSFIDKLTKLEKLRIERVSNIEAFPDLSHCISLTELQLLNNLRLNNFQQIGTIPNLEKFQLLFSPSITVDTRQMLVNQIVPIVLECKTIRHSNITNYTTETVKLQLREKGIEYWNGALDTY